MVRNMDFIGKKGVKKQPMSNEKLCEAFRKSGELFSQRALQRKKKLQESLAP